MNRFFYILMTFFCYSVYSGVADETYFFWYGSAPDSVSWAPFDWEGQGRTSGFTPNIEMGSFYNHTPNAGDNVELNRALTFGADALTNIGAHHPTVLPGGVGTVSIWVYYDYSYGISMNDTLNTVYLSTVPGFELVKGKYLGVEMIFNANEFRVVSSDKPAGMDGPTILLDDWNHVVFIDDGNSTKVLINEVDTGIKLTTGGNLRYINLVNGRVNNDGTLRDGESFETWYFDDIVCTSPIESGYEILVAPLTSNQVVIDGVIHSEEISGANRVIWDGSSTERPGVHAQFYGQWQLPTPEDMTATAYLQNDGTTLYISIDVVDDIVNVAESASWWEEDSTEIYIDHDRSRSTSEVTQISVRADNGLGNQGDFSDWLMLESKLKPEKNGWQIEAGINLSTRQLSQDQIYGFDISINDSDGENEAGYQGAQEWLYASYEFAYSNETYWGNIRILSREARISDWTIFE